MSLFEVDATGPGIVRLGCHFHEFLIIESDEVWWPMVTSALHPPRCTALSPLPPNGSPDAQLEALRAGAIPVACDITNRLVDWRARERIWEDGGKRYVALKGKAKAAWVRKQWEQARREIGLAALLNRLKPGESLAFVFD